MRSRGKSGRLLARHRLAFWLLAPFSCTTTIDPTPIGANAPSSNDILPTCSFTDTASSRYTICPSPLSYAVAFKDCDLRAAHLVSIQSQEENEVVANIAFSSVTGNVWIGGERTEDLTWSWTDGSVFWRGGASGSPASDAFTRWQPGEPNDSSTVTADPERCLALTVGDFDWNDRSCSLSLPYVCERELAGN